MRRLREPDVEVEGEAEVGGGEGRHRALPVGVLQQPNAVRVRRVDVRHQNLRDETSVLTTS